jgi:hypothetical protein
MEHAVGEGLVLDIFKDLMLQTLPDSDPRIPPIKKKLRVICREEAEHVAWGEKETARLLKEKPWLAVPYFGLVELQLQALPVLVRSFRSGYQEHPVLSQLDAFLEHVSARVHAQGRALGFIPEKTNRLGRAGAMAFGLGLYLRSQFSRSTSRLEKTYLSELGFR